MSALSVVVPCRDRATLLAGSLPAICAALRPGDELVVVDAASTTPEVATTATAAGARVVRSEQPAATAARNAGWAAAQHDLVAFLDDDCRPDPGWADAVVAALADLDAVCGRMVAEGDGHLSVLDHLEPRDYRLGDDVEEFGHGGNLAVRRRALAEVSGWDARLGPGTPWPGAEDKDLLLRLLASGHRAGYRPGPVVRHVQWRTRRQVLKAELGYAQGLGALAVNGRRTGLPAPGVAATTAASLRTTGRDLRSGYQLGALIGVVRTGGILWGASTAARRLR
jgi:glycosyltransferase involved in cell wall biosynthesis